jgi:pyruvate dehydrogenase E2 component (dihydrolipoamide acetyltransferase)
MATPVLMPRQGITVESCIILEWKKDNGDKVKEGEVICIVETDKASFEVESPAGGTLLERFFNEGDDVPVLTNIAVIGAEGEDYEDLRPEKQMIAKHPVGEQTEAQTKVEPDEQGPKPEAAPMIAVSGSGRGTRSAKSERKRRVASARARRLAESKGISLSEITGTGPRGRIIERDVIRAAAEREPLSPAAIDKAQVSSTAVPFIGSGIGGRVLSADIQDGDDLLVQTGPRPDDRYAEIPVSGIRKIIAGRMLASLQSTAQLTLNASAEASGLLEYRKKLKTSPEEYELRDVTITAMVLYITSRILTQYRELNALYVREKILQYENVHMGFAVDTPKGLIVPVIRNAHLRSLKEIASESIRLSRACMEGKVNPDEITGGTFTVTNLGNMGIESFTPVLNTPQVAVLGVGSTQIKPVEQEGEVAFKPHLGLSLTIDHQVVDGAPAARFLHSLCQAIANIEVILAL